MIIIAQNNKFVFSAGSASNILCIASTAKCIANGTPLVPGVAALPFFAFVLEITS